jgi:Ca-activated chloride channel family protein
MRSWILSAIAAVLLVAGIASSSNPPSGKIIGAVTDEKGEPIPGVTVKIDSTSMGAAAGIDGSYMILNVPPGTYDMSAQTVGYTKTTVKEVVVKANTTTRQDFKLVATAIEQKTITVMAEPKTIDAHVMSNEDKQTAKQIETMPVNNLGQLLKAQPGFVKQGGQLHARGGRAGEISYIIDGIEVKDPQGGYGTYRNPNIRINGDEFNTENYDRIYENEFLNVTDNPLSTFSIDVDAASYSNIRRFINQGRMPPADAVRIEEMINYFTYEYPQPDGNVPFSMSNEVSECPWNDAHKLVHIGLQGKKIATEDLPPGNIVFLLDVSGSMNMPDKLPLLKRAFNLLVNELRKEDRVAIVVYAGAAGLVLPSTPGNQKETILSAIENLYAGGCTAGGAGIRLAYDVATRNFIKGGNNRVILATDGDFNVGASSDAEMMRLIEEERRKGVFLSVLGFGQGNLKDSKMEKIADKGNGNFSYIDNIMEAQKVLVSEMGATLFTIAKDVKLQIEFNPARVNSYRLIGYEDRILAKEDFNDDKKDAGEIGAGHSVTALYEIVPAGVSEKSRSVDKLKYQKSKITRAAYKNAELLTVKIRYKDPDGDKSKLLSFVVMDPDRKIEDSSINFRFSAAVAEMGMLLRSSQFEGNGNYDQVLSLARGSAGADPHGYRAEFIRLVETCRNLGSTMAADKP